MKIGDKRIIINKIPYHPFIGHCDNESVTMIEIEIIEEKVGKGEFTGEERKGYLAKGSDGILYGFNYPTVNEGFGSTSWVRYMPDEEFLKLSDDEKSKFVDDYIWPDIADYQFPIQVPFTKDKDYISFCEEHQTHYYEKCVKCEFDLPVKVRLNTDEHLFKGFY